MEFCLLGPLEVIVHGEEVAIGGGRRRALLAILLLHRNEVVPAERLIDELWDGDPPPTAAKGLQVQVSQLRRELGRAPGADVALLTRAGGYVLTVPDGATDVMRFERCVDEAERARAAGRVAEAAAQLRVGLRLWRGPPLADFTYEPFAAREIARLEELRLAALEARIDADLALGRHAAVVAELEALVAAHPLRERARGLLMLALHRCGRQSDALETFREGRRRSVDDLGLEPGRDLRALESRILADDPELAPPRVIAPRGRAARRAPALLVAAGALVLGAAMLAVARDGSDRPATAAPLLDLAANAAVALDPAGSARPRFAVPLPGRATDLAAHGPWLYAVSVDSSALSIIDARTRRLARTIPLGLRPAAVAADDRSVWIADGRRGLLVRLRPGYEEILARARWRRAAGRETIGLGRTDATAVAVTARAAWATDGSSRLIRAGEDGRVSRVQAPHALTGVTAGAGAVWAISRRGAAVVRVDPAAGRVTDVIPIAGRPGSEAPAPIAVAATPASLWVLNANTATVTRIDARTRGITQTIQLGLEQQPLDIEAGAGAVWVAGFDGSLTRLGGRTPQTALLGESIVGVAATAGHVWAATTALDQQMPGGPS